MMTSTVLVLVGLQRFIRWPARDHALLPIAAAKRPPGEMGH